MDKTPAVLLVATVISLLGAARADAQYSTGRPQPDRSVGEVYWVEFAADFWNPGPQISMSSESLGIPGTMIDFISDLGIEKSRFRQFSFVVRPATKHKFRFGVTPIKYEASSVLTRTLVFNGINYQIGVPVDSTLQWNAWRLGYEYDFLYRKQGYVGLILEVKYTDVQVNLDSLVAAEYARARAPVPAIGGVGRVYVSPNVALTFEVSGIGLPRKIGNDTEARYVEYDFYGTANFNRHVGAQIGYRAIDVNYTIDLDTGDFLLKGPYFGIVARF